jgi:4-hydroxybenzoate polyprenyltransferase
MTAYLQLARPPQWVKNVFVLAGLLFGGTKLLARGVFLDSVVLAFLAFVAFCLASSACYSFNDLIDCREDRLHPVKRNRPIARGAVRPVGAVAFAVCLFAAAVGLSLPIGRNFTLILILYIVLTTVYSLALKSMVILDGITISVGFVLRAWAGAVAVNVPVSPWLIVCTFTLSLFLGFGKRRCELAMLGDNASARTHRATLEFYSVEFLNHLISVSAGITVVTFMLYAMDGRTVAEFGTDYLVYTTPLVIYGVFRYALLIESGRVTGPTDFLLNDRPFLVVVLIWLLLAVGIIYKGRNLQHWLTPPARSALFCPTREPPDPHGPPQTARLPEYDPPPTMNWPI